MLDGRSVMAVLVSLVMHAFHFFWDIALETLC